MGRRKGSGRQTLEGISVFVRVRKAAEDGGEISQVVEVNESETSVCVRDNEKPHKSIECAFDRVFAHDSTQEDVFLGLVPALDTVVKGFNACVFAYGQTGSGKTHTLIGPGGGTRLADDRTEWGIIPRAVQFLFDRLNLASEEDETFSYSVTCSFLQIYNENLVDLLLQDGGTGTNSTPLQIREEAGGAGGRKRARGGSDAKNGGRSRYNSEDVNGDVGDAAAGVDREGRALGVVGHHQNCPIPKPSANRTSDNRRVFVNGLSSFRVGGAQDVLRYVNLGAANRRVRATQHNEASSRSHAVMQLTVEVKSGGGGRDDDGREETGGSGHMTYRQAKLSLVDLAGSEKMDSGLHISKGHFKELRSVNQSLSTLGNVVSALSEKGRTHVPYRDSKLTRLLQDSLGGNTRTTIIACVNPLAGQTHETINTLQFADRAKKVMVHIRANEVVDDRVLLARAQAEIKRLKRRLREALEGTLLGGYGEGDGVNDDTASEVNGVASPHGQGGSSHENALSSKKVEDLGRCESKAGADGVAGVKDDGAESSVPPPTIVPNEREQRHPSLAEEKGCETVRISAAASSAAAGTAFIAAAAQKRKAARLITENESLREENDRLRADVQRLVAQNSKQRSKRQRQQQQRQRNVGRWGDAWNGAGSRRPPPSPIDWSARYADAAADARRRRPASSSHRSRSLTRSASPSSSVKSRTVAMRTKRSTSPTPAATASASAAAAAPVLPKFRRRQFGLDVGAQQDTRAEDETVEDTLSGAEVREMVELNSTEEAMAATASGDPASLEEEEREAEEVSQLAMFHRELRDGVVSGSFVKRGGGDGGGEGSRRGGGGAGGVKETVLEQLGYRGDTSDSNVNPDELADIEVFLDQSQRLEDLMFEAEGRERQRLREERGRLASARAQRLALEAQLVALTGGGDGSTISAQDGAEDADRQIRTHPPPEKSSVAAKRTSLTMPPVLATILSPRTGNDGEQAAAGAMVSKQRPQHPQPQRPPPSFDGALFVHREHGRTATATETLPTARKVESTTTTRSNDHRAGDKDKLRENNAWEDQASEAATIGDVTSATEDPTPTPSTTAATTAMMMAVLASAEQVDSSSIGDDVHDSNRQDTNADSTNLSGLEPFSGRGAGRTVRATKPPLQQNGHGRGTIPTSPSSSLSRRVSHPSTSSLRQRPATSTGYPPTGGSGARSKSRRIRHRAGVRMGGSRSPIRTGRLAFVEPASPQDRRNRGRRGTSQDNRLGQTQQRQRQQQQGTAGDRSVSPMFVAAASSDRRAAAKALQAVDTPPLSPAPLGKDQRLGGKAGGSGTFGAGVIESERATKRSLTHSVADLGLRLKVYSFRYDHYYECQVVGYDSRRRMHRCAYDATGERHWHDLANKRFEVVGQNGVIVRSTASAPPAPALGHPTMDATKKSFSNQGSGDSSTTPLLLPTSPSNPLGISFGGRLQ